MQNRIAYTGKIMFVSPKLLSDNLKKLMEVRGINSAQLAREASLQPSTIGRILDGTIESPRLSTIKAIALRFGLEPEELVSEDAIYKVGTAKYRTGEWIPQASNKDLAITGFIGNLYAGDPSEKIKIWLPPCPDRDVRALMKDKLDAASAEIYAYEAPDDALSPYIQPGDILYVQSLLNGPVDYKDGIYLIRLNSDGNTENYYFSPRLLKRVNNNMFYIRATSKDWPAGTEWASIDPDDVMGLVLGIYRKLSEPINS